MSSMKQKFYNSTKTGGAPEAKVKTGTAPVSSTETSIIRPITAPVGNRVI